MKEDKFFLDTNIFAYSFDEINSAKQSCAENIIEKALTTQQGVISYQVVQEFCNLATRKFVAPLPAAEQRLYLQRVLMPLCRVLPSFALYNLAIDIREQYKFSFYDALIVASAIEACCKILYTEDLQHGQNILGIKIVNPFNEVNKHTRK